MQVISIRTTQNVIIEYPVAGVFNRMLAYLIDSVIMYAFALLMWLLIGLAGAIDNWIITLIIVFPIFFYHLVFEITMNGQSPGKRAMRLKVSRLDGSNPTISNYIVRWLFRLIDVMISFGSIAIISILFTKYEQRLGDLAAATVVVKLVPVEATRGQHILLNLDENYTPTFPQVVQLSDKDIDLVKQAIQMSQSLGNMVPAVQVETKLKSLLGIETTQPTLAFLENVLKDYSHLTSGNER